MVSTRGLKVKFSEGEKVLCFEPDPTKAKVLYDSKVLEVIMNKDGKGKRYPEYLIHFQQNHEYPIWNGAANELAAIPIQHGCLLCTTTLNKQGWNASWDRCVSEDLVLKDTEENRELQRRLSEEALEKLNEKKKRGRLSETLQDGFDFEMKIKDSESALQVDDGETSVSSESDDTYWQSAEKSKNNENYEDAQDASDDDCSDTYAPLSIPDALKAVLEKDYYFINEKHKLVDLPAEKNILTILEDYVKQFAARHSYKDKKKSADVKIKDRSVFNIELCKEIVDGLRVCFDFLVYDHLLYNKEANQVERLKPVKIEQLCRDSSHHSVNTTTEEEKSPKKEQVADFLVSEVPAKRQLRSYRPQTAESQSAVTAEKEKEKQPPNPAYDSGRSTPSTLGSGNSISGNLSEHVSPVSKLSGSHLHLQDWSILPEAYRNPPPPVMIFGAIHLLRLFVKLPDFLCQMSLVSEKRKLIMKHLHLFLDYLNTYNQDFFTDAHYIPNSEA